MVVSHSMEGIGIRQQATLARSNTSLHFMGYAVFTCAKGKGGAAAEGGLSAHIERQIWDAKQQKMVDFLPKSVKHPELTELNKEYILPPGMSSALSTTYKSDLVHIPVRIQ